jgi:hypothetical protein
VRLRWVAHLATAMFAGAGGSALLAPVSSPNLIGRPRDLGPESSGKAVIRKKCSRRQLLAFTANLEVELIDVRR